MGENKIIESIVGIFVTILVVIVISSVLDAALLDAIEMNKGTIYGTMFFALALILSIPTTIIGIVILMMKNIRD